MTSNRTCRCVKRGKDRKCLLCGGTGVENSEIARLAEVRACEVSNGEGLDALPTWAQKAIIAEAEYAYRNGVEW